MSDYPEHDKLTAVAADSHKIGEFLEWLTGDRGLTIARFSGREATQGFKIERLLAEYFEIDLGKIEVEKRTMLESLRAAQAV